MLVKFRDEKKLCIELTQNIDEMSDNSMQSFLQNTKISQDYQLSFSKIKERVLPLYNEFVPEQIKNRRNIEQQIQPDFIIISAVI